MTTKPLHLRSFNPTSSSKKIKIIGKHKIVDKYIINGCGIILTIYLKICLFDYHHYKSSNKLYEANNEKTSR